MLFLKRLLSIWDGSPNGWSIIARDHGWNRQRATMVLALIIWTHSLSGLETNCYANLHTYIQRSEAKSTFLLRTINFVPRIRWQLRFWGSSPKWNYNKIFMLPHNRNLEYQKFASHNLIIQTIRMIEPMSPSSQKFFFYKMLSAKERSYASSL